MQAIARSSKREMTPALSNHESPITNPGFHQTATGALIAGSGS